MEQSRQQFPGTQQEERQPGFETGQQTGQQTRQHQTGPMGHQQSGQVGQQVDLMLQDVETPEQRQAVFDVTRAIQTCAWCADQCIQEADSNMVECIRLCQDVTELGSTALELVPRQSRYARTVLQALEQAIYACGQECGSHHHNHCQECAGVLEQAATSVQQLEQTWLQ